jgi:hypothetical protein
MYKNAWMYYMYNQLTRSYTQRCVAQAESEASCLKNYGTSGFIWDYQSKTSSEVYSEKQNNCRPESCFNTLISSQKDCYNLASYNYTSQKYNRLQDSAGIQYYPYWQFNFNNTNGYCVAQRSGSSTGPLQSKASCLQLGKGWNWYGERTFDLGWGETKAACSAGICNVNPALQEADCKGIQSCSYGCQGCRSNNGDSICIHYNQTLCQSDSASWDSNKKFCVYKGPMVSNCLSRDGSFVVTCSQFTSTNSTMCVNSQYQNYLQCNWGYEPCDTPKRCYEAGYCSDWDIQSGVKYDDISGNGACVFPPRSIGNDGWPLCNYPSYVSSKGQQVYFYNVRSGCLANGEGSPSNCEAKGGSWVTKSKTPESCEMKNGCCEPGKQCGFTLTPKNQFECESCGGFVTNFYQWRGGNWLTGKMVPGTWFKKQVSPINTWSTVVNMNTLFTFVNQAVSMYVGNVLSREFNCRYRPLFPLLKAISCKCGINTGNECNNVNSQDMDLGSETASCGQNLTINAGSAVITFGSSSIQNCSNAFSFSYGNRNGAPSSSSSSSNSTMIKREYVDLGKRYDSTQIPASCYSLVQNNYSAYIGQIRGDCATFSPSGPVSNIEICTNIKASIPYDGSSYPTLGVATSYTDSKNAIRYNVSSLLTGYTKGTSVCAIVNQGGIYCPVSLMANWASVTSRAQPNCNLASQSLNIISSASQVLAGSAVKIVFSVQPSSKIVAGSPGENLVTVKFVDANGNLASDSKASVTLNILAGSGTSGAVLLGTARQSAVSGFAVFSDISVSLVGSDYYLQAISGNLPSVLSTAFSVSAGPALALVYTVQPVTDKLILGGSYR